MGMKEFIIQIQEKEDGNIVKTWDYGTEAFEKQLKDALEEKIKEKGWPWYLRLFAAVIFSFIGEALSEAVDYLIRRAEKNETSVIREDTHENENRIYNNTKPTKEDKGNLEEGWKDKVRTAVFLIVIATVGCVWIVHAYSHEYLIIPIVGMVSFIIPLLLSFSSKYNLGTKLSKGEVRKSIVISLTVVYIILLSLSFYQTTYGEPTINVTSNTSIITTNINTFNVTAQTVPIQAIGNFTQNFLYVYIVIIGFYFGSRLGERIKMFKELKDLSPLDIAKKRYAMGEIDFETFDKMKKELK